jgi:hypothetical protein
MKKEETPYTEMKEFTDEKKRKLPTFFKQNTEK